MQDNLIEVLQPLGYPVRLQGSLLPNESYPPHFFTFWNDAADGSGFYSNTESATVWQFSLNFYSVDPQKVNTMLLEAKKLLKAAGWVVTGKGYTVASDEPTHTGRGITILYRENE